MDDTEERFLRLDAVVKKTGRARASIYRMMSEGSFPKQEKIGLRAVGWRLSAVMHWMNAPDKFRQDMPSD
jgi:prophage regulatory protein